MYKIKILKDTPFDKAGTVLSQADFRLKYNYICTNNVSDQELIDYLKHENSLTADHPNIEKGISEWFQIKDFPSDSPHPGVPLQFIYEGILYAKQLDGCFHKFVVGVEIIPENSIGSIQIADARLLYKKAKYKRLIPYITNRLNIKL